MKKQHKQFPLRASVLAVQGALVALTFIPVLASAQSVEELTQRTSTVEAGITSVDKSSYKFGEFNGLQKQGETANLNVELNGGAAYDSGGVTRYRIQGSDLGLEDRNITVQYGEQGKFRLNFGYDELLRNRSDSYQTPLNGAGTNKLTLPSNWLVPLQQNVNPNKSAPALVPNGVNARALDPNFINNDAVYRFNNAANATAVDAPSAIYAPTQAQINQMLSVAATDQADFHNVNLNTKRTKYEVGGVAEIDSHWEIAFGVRQEFKLGAKPMSTVSRNTGGDIAMVIPDLIDTRTDQYDLSLNFRNANSFFTAAYYGSLFTNNVQSMSWQNWATGTQGTVGAAFASPTTNMMSSAPSNQFHQFNLTGGYNFTHDTKLVVNAAYGRNTQDDAYLSTGTELGSGLPRTSLGGVVITQSLNAKLTSKVSKDWGVAAGYKFDQRDNQTPVSNYVYYEAGETKAGTSIFNSINLGWTPTGGALGSGANINANRTYSKRTNQLNLDADYAITARENIKFGADWQQVNRYCNGSWIDCVDAANTNETTLRTEWRAAMGDSVSARIGVAHSNKTVGDYNENAFLALVPMANQTASNAPAGTTAYSTMNALGFSGAGPWVGSLTPAQIAALTPAQAYYFGASGTTPLAQASYGNGNRISELIGMRRYNMADRNRDKLRSMLNWDVSEKLSLQGGVDYNNDNYANSVYGLQKSTSTTFNLDAKYTANENTSFGAFYTNEDQKSVSAGNNLASNNTGLTTNSYVGTTTATNIVGNTACGGANTIAARNQNNKTDPCNNWSYDMRDKVDTLGISFNQKNLMAGKLDMTADLIYSSAKSDVTGAGGAYVNNPAAVANAPATVTTGAYYITAGSMPTVTTETIELKLKGKYTLDKKSAVRMSYSYSKTKIVDWSLDSMQYGTTGSGVLPTLEQAPDYTVQTVGVSYVYTF